MSAERPISTRWHQHWKTFQFRDWMRGLLSPGDSTHELALGASIGMFVAFTPLFGLHLAMIIFVAFVLQKMVRFNKALAVATSYVSNPITFAPILWSSYKVGACLLPTAAGALDHSQITTGIDWRHGLTAIPKYLQAIGWPMLVGCLVLGVVMSVVTYTCTFAVVSWYRGRETFPNSPLDSVSTPRESASITSHTKPE